MLRRKLRKPYFVKATLLKDGTAEPIDDEGEVFHVTMDRREAWPMLSRQVRRFESMEHAGHWETVRVGADPEPPIHPDGRPNLKLVS
jgi:hypothetical protein